MEDKSFQIDRASEEGKWGRGHNIGLAVHNVGVEGGNLEDADERKSPRTELDSENVMMSRQ